MQQQGLDEVEKGEEGAEPQARKAETITGLGYVCMYVFIYLKWNVADLSEISLPIKGVDIRLF